MQSLNPMQLGPPASKSKGETLSSKMLLSNSGAKGLEKGSAISETSSSSTLPSVPPYGQSLLDIDCEGGYNVSTLSPSNDIPLITSPSITPSSNIQDEKEKLAR